jgi:hypothetical protein
MICCPKRSCGCTGICIAMGNCRVVANPLGYARKNEQLFFKPASCISV